MGLLDLANDPTFRIGLGLLAAGRAKPVQTGFGEGLLTVINNEQAHQQAQEDRKQRQTMQGLQAQLLQAQIGETSAQADQRRSQALQSLKRQQMVDSWLRQAQGDLPAANAETVRQTGNLAPTLANAQVHSQALEQRHQSNPLFGIPMQAIHADLSFNDGKGISDMIFKRGTPNLQVHNGVVMDMNSARPGTTLPTISQDGKASQLIPDPSAPGGYRVVAPQGSVDTYRAFRDADEASKARHDLVKVFNPATGREEYVSRELALNRAAPEQRPTQQPQPNQPQQSGSAWRVPSAVQAQRDVERLAILNEELRRATSVEDRTALQREIARLKPSAPGPLAAGPNSREASQAKYDEGVQKDLIERRKTIFDAADVAGGRINSLVQLQQLLGQHDGGSLSPTGLQIAKAANSFGIKIDPQLGNKEAAVALSNQMALDLRNPAGGAGMPGALSDADRNFLVNMVPGLQTSAKGRTTMIQAAVALEQRKQEVAQFARNYEAKHGRIDSGFFDQLAAWSKANPMFKGQ